jgi:glycosyltransferase involved in cell wall biosynthesis
MKATIVIPTRNEEAFIAECLDSVLANDFPKKEFEIIIADGMSADKTCGIIKEYQKKHKNITLLENKKINTAAGLNLAIKKAKGKYIVRMDAHTVYAKDYIKNCIELIEQKKGDNVGGPAISVATNTTGKAIAAVTTTPFCMGGADFRNKNAEGYTETVYLGTFEKELFEKIGYFDESTETNQDDEFNYRMTEKGYKIYLSPKIKSKYYCRNSFKKLFIQYFKYGFFKIRVLEKHIKSIKLRQIVPAIFLLTIIFLLLASIFSKTAKTILFSTVTAYLIFLIIAATIVSIKNKLKYFPLSLIAIAIIQTSYGAGFILGIIKRIIKKIEDEK